MEPTYFAQYRGFEFQCSPERIGDHAFAPRLVIYDASEAVSVEIALGAPSSPITNPTVAAHQAFAQGRRALRLHCSAIRQLAGDLGLAANTVARAYRELEVDGFVRSTGRRGTVVIRTAPPSWPS